MNEAAQDLSEYRAELNAFRKEFGGERRLPDARFFLFGMGPRSKFLYQGGRLLEAGTGAVIREWMIRKDIILPPDYLVALELQDGSRVTLSEDEQAVWIAENGERQMLAGTQTPVSLPSFDGHRFRQVLRVLHHELLISITDAGPVPNFFIYHKPWYRDAAMIALVLKKTGNLGLIREWILGLRDPFDRNNRIGEMEADNLGQVLFLVSLVSDKDHPVVSKALEALLRYETTGPYGKYIKGRTDFGEHPVYQTKWAKFGLRSLGLPDPYVIPAVPDTYSAVFWMAFPGVSLSGIGVSEADRLSYPYLGWACDHFYGVKKSPISDQDYPLTWEQDISRMDQGAPPSDPLSARRDLAAPHAWHAAEVFLYLIQDKVSDEDTFWRRFMRRLLYNTTERFKYKWAARIKPEKERGRGLPASD